MKAGKISMGAARRIFSAVRKVEGMISPAAASRPIDRKPPQIMFAVRVEIDGGAAGDAATDCTWTYLVKTDSGYELGSGMTPEKCRLPMVPYEFTPNGSWGAGFFDKAGAFVLWDANECPQVQEC